MRIYFKTLLAALCASLAFTVAASANNTADISVARVGETEVSLGQLRALLPDLTPEQREVLGKNPAALRQSVQAALLQQLLVQSAQQAQWDANPRAIHEMRRAQNAALAESFLEGITALPESYPQESELRAFYEANKSQLMLPARYHIAQIFVAEPQDDSREARRAAEKKREAVAAALKKDSSVEGFAKAARAHSDESVSAKEGGDIGWLPVTQIVPELRQALEGVSAGSVVGPVRLPGGWHWVRCNEVSEAQPVALDMIREQLVARMRAERINASRQAYLERLLRSNPIVLNELALIQLVRADSESAASDVSAIVFDPSGVSATRP